MVRIISCANSFTAVLSDDGNDEQDADKSRCFLNCVIIAHILLKFLMSDCK
jgi:hypothetical protein